MGKKWMMAGRAWWMGRLGLVLAAMTASGAGWARDASGALNAGETEAHGWTALTAPGVVTMDQGEHRRAPSGKAGITKLARGHNAFMGLLELDPKVKVPEHQDQTEEYIYVIQGHGTITIDGVETEVEAGSVIFMPAHAKVSYQNGDQTFVGVQVFAGPDPASKYEKWSPVDDSQIHEGRAAPHHDGG